MDSVRTHDLITHPCTKATKDAILLLLLESDVFHAQLGCHLTNGIVTRAHGQDQLDDQSPGTKDAVGLRKDLYPLRDGVGARGGHPGSSGLPHLHEAQAAGTIGLDRLIVTEMGDLEPRVQSNG